MEPNRFNPNYNPSFADHVNNYSFRTPMQQLKTRIFGIYMICGTAYATFKMLKGVVKLIKKN